MVEYDSELRAVLVKDGTPDREKRALTERVAVGVVDRDVVTRVLAENDSLGLRLCVTETLLVFVSGPIVAGAGDGETNVDEVNEVVVLGDDE